MKLLLCIYFTMATTCLYGFNVPECVVEKPDFSNLSESKAALKKMQVECLPKIMKINECLTRARLLSENVSNFLNKFRYNSGHLLVNSFGASGVRFSDTDLNIWRNFLALEQRNSRSLDAIDVLAKKYQGMSESILDIRGEIENLDRDYAKTTQTISTISDSENVLLAFIESVRIDLELSHESVKKEAVFLAGDTCKDAEIIPMITRVEAAFQSFLDDAETINDHILKMRNARQNLVNYTYAALRDRLETAYTEKSIEQLSSIGGKIDIVLRASRLSARFENWKYRLSTNSQRDKILTVYHQYEEAKQILAADYVVAKNFKEQMLAVSEQYPETAVQYLARIDGTISAIETSLNRLEQAGWKGKLTLQKSVAKRLLSRPELLSSECHSRYANYVSRAEDVSSLEHYKIVEKEYMRAVISCTKDKQ